jgi:hypothetical protein
MKPLIFAARSEKRAKVLRKITQTDKKKREKK